MTRAEEIARYLHAIFLNPASKLNGVESAFFDGCESETELRAVAAGIEAIFERHAPTPPPSPDSNGGAT